MFEGHFCTYLEGRKKMKVTRSAESLWLVSPKPADQKAATFPLFQEEFNSLHFAVTVVDAQKFWGLLLLKQTRKGLLWDIDHLWLSSIHRIFVLVGEHVSCYLPYTRSSLSIARFTLSDMGERTFFMEEFKLCSRGEKLSNNNINLSTTPFFFHFAKAAS